MTSTCSTCGTEIRWVKTQRYPVKWRPDNVHDGEKHECWMRDPRLKMVMCVKCNEGGRIGIFNDWAQWLDHSRVYGCTVFRKWSLSWLNN
jgi:hypothetical protein